MIRPPKRLRALAAPSVRELARSRSRGCAGAAYSTRIAEADDEHVGRPSPRSPRVALRRSSDSATRRLRRGFRRRSRRHRVAAAGVAGVGAPASTCCDARRRRPGSLAIERVDVAVVATAVVALTYRRRGSRRVGAPSGVAGALRRAAAEQAVEQGHRPPCRSSPPPSPSSAALALASSPSALDRLLVLADQLGLLLELGLGLLLDPRRAQGGDGDLLGVVDHELDARWGPRPRRAMIVSLITISETSTVIRSGISVGSASTVISRVTCSSTPPSRTPGAWSVPSSSIATSDSIASSRRTSRQSRWMTSPRTRVVLLLLDHDRDGVGAIDLEVEQRVALGQQDCGARARGPGTGGPRRPGRRRRRGRGRRGAGAGWPASRSRRAAETLSVARSVAMGSWDDGDRSRTLRRVRSGARIENVRGDGAPTTTSDEIEESERWASRRPDARPSSARRVEIRAGREAELRRAEAEPSPSEERRGGKIPQTPDRAARPSSAPRSAARRPATPGPPPPTSRAPTRRRRSGSRPGTSRRR